MTRGNDPDADGEAVREAAAGWIAAQQRGLSRREQRALNRWLAARSEHAETFDRMTRRFADARVLSSSALARETPRRSERRARPLALVGLAAAAALLLLLFLSRAPAELFERATPDQPAPAPAAGVGHPTPRRLVAPKGDVRAVGLADGSVITLDSASAVAVLFSPDSRRIALLSGRARFSVAHERRPFVVLAGQGTVTAHGTVFDVALARDGGVRVHLLQGAVDVASRPSRSASLPELRALAAGEQTRYLAGRFVEPVAPAPADAAAWAGHASDFDDVSLGYLIAHAAPDHGPAIRLADPDLARLRVSGRFRLDQPARLATNLAALLDLEAVAVPDGIVLRRP